MWLSRPRHTWLADVVKICRSVTWHLHLSQSYSCTGIDEPPVRFETLSSGARGRAKDSTPLGGPQPITRTARQSTGPDGSRKLL
jgi:hypothetical protein